MLEKNNSIFERVKNKNLNLNVQEFNARATLINREGTLFTPDNTYKEVAKKRESLIAQLDTNIHIQKKDGGYISDIGVEHLSALKGTGQQIRTNVLRKEYIEKDSPKKTQESKHKIERNPVSMTINKNRVEIAKQHVKEYEHKRIMNSTPVNKTR